MRTRVRHSEDKSQAPMKTESVAGEDRVRPSEDTAGTSEDRVRPQ